MTHIYILRMIAACVCGFFIGFERKNRSKKAGVRTHVVVACGAALVMIVSKYGFFDMLSLGDDIKHDPSRVASNIITGIGFLGAGMILVNKRSITGLTTAAGIWTTAGIGMAMGAGMYVIGASATVIILFAQLVLHSGQRIFKEPQIRKISVYGVSEEGYQEKAKDILMGLGVTPLDISVSKKDGIYDYSFISEMPLVFSEEEIVSSFAYDAKISAGGE